MKPDLLTIEEMYQQHLKLLGVDEKIMHEHERIERKRMFYAGIAAMFTFFTKVLPEYDDPNDEGQAAAAVVGGIYEQVAAFWEQEVKMQYGT